MKLEKNRPMSFKLLLLAVSVCIATLAILLVTLSYSSVHAGDATSFDPTAVAVQAKGSSDTPIGGVIPWPHSTIPEGWLACNGQSTSGYPELAALVGPTVPDFRGKFLRALDSGKGIDSGRSLLSSQNDAMENHSHTTTITVSGGMTVRGVSTSNSLSAWGFKTSSGAPANQVASFTGSGTGVSTSAGSASENRPVNVAVIYIIKAQ